MQKYLNMLIAILLSICSLSLISCRDDDDEPDSGSNVSIVGTWKGHNTVASKDDDAMTARFYEDGTCEIWWYWNPYVDSYYFTGSYSLSKKKLHLKGYYGSQGSTPYIEYDQNKGCTIKNGVMNFFFDLGEWYITKQ